MADRFDGNWKDWRDRFVSGGDEVTLKWLSEQPGSPSYSSLRKRSAPKWEDWEEQRKNYREQLNTLAASSPHVEKTVQQVAKLIDTAEMLTRHSGLARLVGSIAAHEFKAIRQKQMQEQPTGLKPSDILNFAKVAIEVERLTEGLATERQQIDLSGLPDNELEKLANG